MLPESEAQKALPKSASLPFLDENAVKERIESHPWVEGARVMKDWESGIVAVEVKERRAVLYAELDGRRMAVAADGTELPSLGDENLSKVEIDEGQLEDTVEVGGVLEENGVALDSVDAVHAGGVEATVRGRRVLLAGDVGGAGGVRGAQVKALEGIMEEHADAPYFDLRSPGRVVVGTGTGAAGPAQVPVASSGGPTSSDR